MADRPCHFHFINSQVITSQHNFKASLGDPVPIFYNCSDHVHWQCTSSFYSSDILPHRDQCDQFRRNLSPNHNIHRKKNHVYQRCTSYTSVVWKSVGNWFSSDLETSISYLSWGHLMETVNQANSKETESLVKNGRRQKCLDKSLNSHPELW